MSKQSVNAGNAPDHLDTLSDADWSHICAVRNSGTLAIAEPWQSAFAPLFAPVARTALVIGQIGQSLDGRIATASGQSRYINGPAAIVHLHRLRALVDAVVVGIGTVTADDPQLTVRRVEGPSPARVVIDPQGRILRSAKLLAADGCRRVVVTRPGAAPDLPGDVERLNVDDDGAGMLAPAAIVRARRSAPLQACTAAKAGTMNRPPAIARPHRSIAARSPRLDASTTAGPCGAFAGIAPRVAKPRSSANAPNRTAPASVGPRTMRPRAIAAARPEPIPTAIENRAR